MSQHQGFAGASGEETHTDMRREGNTVTASASAHSTGAGPQQHEAAVLHSTKDPESMTTHELKAYLVARGADLTGAIERRDLVEIARNLPSEGAGAGQA